ncbi:MAG: hypothetical protein J4G05_03095 [Chlorobi bacterium]|nr:hypothetical protein [Chlorobiota bacterium]
MRRVLTTAILFLLGTAGVLHAQIPGPLQEEEEFKVFTPQNAEGYFKPLYTSLQEGFATNLYTTAQYDEKWNIALDISVMGMFIPDDHKTFEAILPESYADSAQSQTAELRNGIINRNVSGTSIQPTVFGDISNPVFSAPQSEEIPTLFNRMVGTVGFPEGNDINLMPGPPHFQLILGGPTRTELRTRIVPIPGGDRTFLYLGFGLNQQIDHFMNLFGEDSTMGLAVNTSFHYMNLTETMDATGFTGGLHFSKSWDGFTLFTGAQYETMTGDFMAEILDNETIAFDLESFNSFRLLGGASYRNGAIEIHADGALAAQPVISAGLTIWIASFK